MTDTLRFPRALALAALTLLAAGSGSPASAQGTRSLRPGDPSVAGVNTEWVTAVGGEQRVTRLGGDAQRRGAR